MVRINIIKPRKLTDQHLIAEYNEILMLFGYVKKHPGTYEVDHGYCLGKGHIRFFKDKLVYLKARHELIKQEMKKRGFQRRKTINLKKFPKNLQGDWKPKKKDFEVIKKRLREKVRQKPNFYRYYREHRTLNFFLELLN
jgi:deoxyribonuclease (pyrimidine dimer)